MRSALRQLANKTGRPPVTLGTGNRFHRGLSFNLGAGRADRETHLRQYGLSGTLYGIISLLAESSATPAWHLYKKPPVDGRRRYSTADQGSDQRIEVVQHAAIQLWNNPNDFHSGFEFREGAQQHEELTGETFWVLDTETAGFPTSMWYVRPDRMEPVPDPDDYLVGWIYTGPNGETVPLKLNEVILEKRPDPIDPYRGAGPVASILPNIQQQRYATEYMRNTFLNGAQPDGVITVPNRLTDVQFDELIDRWREAHRGVARAGKVGVLEDGMTWTERKNTNRDMEYANLRLSNRDELREAWRIHKTMMGTADDVNRANAQTAQEVFVAWQVITRLNRRKDTLNSKLLPLFGATGNAVEFDYEDPSPVNAETAAVELLNKAQAFQALMASGAPLDFHEALEVCGLPDIDEAKTPVRPALPAAPGRPELPPGQPQDRQTIVLRAFAAAQPNTPQTPAAPQPPAEIQTVDLQWKAAVALLTTAWVAHIIPAWYAALLAQIHQHVQSGDIPALAALHVDSGQAADLVLEHTTAYAGAAAQQASNEAAAQGANNVQPQPPARSVLEPAAIATAALLAQQIAIAAGREAARLAGADPDPDDVVKGVRAFLKGLSDASVTQSAAAVLSAAQNQARLATIAAGPRAQLVATEIHDTNTCDPCDDINGTVFGYSDDPAAVAAAEAAYPAAGYILCEGGPRCRGTMFGLYQMGRAEKPAALAPYPAISNGKDTTAKVFQQVAQDYPPEAMAWMHHAAWTGPVKVPLDHIDWTPGEMDGADPGKVARFVDRLQRGKKVNPVIAVKTPGADRLQLVDGHHRYLAAAELAQPVKAFIGTVDADHGAWEAMHNAQRRPDAVTNAATLSKQQTHYRTASEPGRRCGSCSMFREPNACTLVQGLIQADGVCDRWAAKASQAAALRRILSDGYVPVEHVRLGTGAS